MTDASSIFNHHQKASVHLGGGKKSFLLKSVFVCVVLLAFFIKSATPHPVTELNPNLTSRSLLFDDRSSANHPKNCAAPAINEFPPDGFSRAERRQGWILLHILVGCYSFWSLAIICHDYFVPAISEICQNLHWRKDVVGATIMAAASSSPELFMNFIATFVTKNDIGVGSVVGSALFNILLVPAFCGLFVNRTIILDWWPLTRDSLMYCVSILCLIATVYDGKVMWYEAAGLVLVYGIYLLVMCYNDRLTLEAKKIVAKWRGGSIRAYGYREVLELTPLLVKATDLGPLVLEDEVEAVPTPWDRRDGSFLMFLARWPLTFLFWLTIPDCRRRPRWKYLTFFASVMWIAAISYVVAFVITILGDTLDIPDSVMGLTVLAAGMSVPEAAASIIVTRQGQGSMGLSNIIGSNIFDILLCLGLPWLLKSCLLPAGHAVKWIAISSGGFTYSTVFLLASLFGLYAGCALNKFILDWRIGLSCCLMYVGFLAVALPIGLNVFSSVNLPICQH